MSARRFVRELTELTLGWFGMLARIFDDVRRGK